MPTIHPLHLFNSITRKKERFTPIDASNIRMYVCGPTVYSAPHIGNARAVVVYDILYRLLIRLYGARHITYVRNITDVDDKINEAAKKRGIAIQDLTNEIYSIFSSDMHSLACFSPTYEPRATAHIPDMIAMIEQLIRTGHAYITHDHVYFSVASDPHYGALAGRKLEQLLAGARIEVSENKEHPGDFVLWKPANSDDDPSSVFASPWGAGRPGWHIECSAMSTRYLGPTFDIHGGGADLMFPHHTNEIAQSQCCFPESQFARTWVHNGFVTVEGEKMSKSLGNIVTIHDLLQQGIHGETIRFFLLNTHYRKPLDWNKAGIMQAKKSLDSFYIALDQIPILEDVAIPSEIMDALCDDMNTPLAISYMHSLAKQVMRSTKPKDQLFYASQLYVTGQYIGLFANNPDGWFASSSKTQLEQDIIADIEARISERTEAKRARNYALADSIRDSLSAEGIILHDRHDGSTTWERES